MNRVDEILAAIDVGLQKAGDTSYGNDSVGRCWRCRGLSDKDLCASCRTELLAETPPRLTPKQFVVVDWRPGFDLDWLFALSDRTQGEQP